MATERNALKAGIFILVSVAAIIAVIIAISGLDRFVEPWQRRTVTFKLTDDVGGLKVGDEVRIGGAKVGHIKEILVQPPAEDGSDVGQILVEFAMPKKYVLRDSANIRIQSTVTGASWLNIDHMGAGKEVPEEVALVGKPGMFTVFADAIPEVKQILTDVRTKTLPKINDTVDSFKGTGDSAKEFIALLHGKVDPIIERYFKIADPAAEAMTNIKDITGEGKGDIKGTLANLHTATGTVKEKLPPIMDKMDATLAKVQGAVDHATAALVDVKATVANAKELTASAKGAIIGNRGRIDAMIASLKTTGDNLKNASAEIRRSPWRLLYKPKPGEMANLNLYDAARQFAEGANDLSDAATSLRDALQDKEIDQEQIQKLMEQLDTSFSNISKVETQL